MQYKTMILELLEERPRIREQLRKDRKLLQTTEQYARELKGSHEAWKELLADLRQDSDKNQIASEALELALKELQDRLPPDTPESDHLFLDAAMLFVRRHPTSRG